MSLFQCYECGCRENTATCNFWSRMDGEWRGVQSKPWMLCSACDPDIGKWHGQFERVLLPIGMFKTNQRGNLEHIETGSEDCLAYALTLNGATS